MTEVRRAQPDDWQEWRKIRLTALLESPASFGSNYARELAFTEVEWRLGMVARFIAYDKGTPVGLVAGVPGEPDEPQERQASSMWVAPEARGSEAASLLMAAVKEWARADGAAELALWVADFNLRARKFYAREGFVPSGVRMTVCDGQPVEGDKLTLRL